MYPVNRYLLSILIGGTIFLNGCGGDVEDPIGSSSGNSSSGGTSGAVEKVRVMSKDYIDSKGEDAERNGATSGPCAKGMVDLMELADGSCAIGFTRPGESVSYTVDVPEGMYDLALKLATAADGDRSVLVKINGVLRADLNDIPKDGWESYNDIEFISAPLKSGKNTVTIEFVTGGVNFAEFTVSPYGKVAGINLDNPNPSKGKQIWETQCVACHNDATDYASLTDKRLVESSESTMENLVTKIHVSMPIGATANCEFDCAVDVAAYIAQSNDNFGSGSTVDDPDAYPAPSKSVDAPAIAMARLNKPQLLYTIEDLFGLTKTLDATYPGDTPVNFFYNNAESLFTTNRHLRAFDALFTEVVDSAFAGTPPNKVVPCNMGQGESCAKTVAKEFGLRAWRRPLTSTEINRFGEHYRSLRAQVDTNKKAFKLLVKTILLSPNFMYRPEIDDNLNSDSPRMLTDYELASRLSYFIWSSTPDDALLEAARKFELTTSNGLEQQVERMLRDDKATRLVDEFASHWLGLGNVKSANPNAQEFPEFDSELAEAMIGETHAFFSHIIKENRPIKELLSANYTFLNKTMADFYGVPGSFGDAFKKHDWGNNGQRNGVMTHASVLTAAGGTGDEPSTVVRGAWTLQRLLCKEPPPVSDALAGLFPTISLGLSSRQHAVAHRTNPVCAGCHKYMDPIGLGLDNYNKIGQWQDFTPDGDPIDPAGTLPGIFSFMDGPDLQAKIADTNSFNFCFATHLSTYALGRGVNALEESNDISEHEPSDYSLIYNLVNKAGGEPKVTDVLKAIVTSDAFTKRRGANTLAGEAQ